jgi:hypothetical protein
MRRVSSERLDYLAVSLSWVVLLMASVAWLHCILRQLTMIGLQNLKTPVGGVTLERLVSEVEQEVAWTVRCRTNLNPIVGAFRQAQIASDLVELSPTWASLLKRH